MATDRTEKPTGRRLRDARKKGQVARSRDLVQAGTLAAVLVALGWSGAWMMEGLGRAVGNALSQMHRFPAHDLMFDEVGSLALDGLRTLLVLVAPVALTAMVTVIALFTAQSGWVFASEALQLNFSKLNPVTGAKKLGFSGGGIDTLKMIVLVTVLTFISYRVIEANLLDNARYARMSPFQAAIVGWGDVERLLRQSALAMLFVAGADYGIQRWRHTKSLMMTKQEVKDDMKMMEGNPEIKARVRQVMMTMARKRMMAAVPKATVIITNPTHYAVALEYQRAGMAAPRVIAKGRGFLAQKIKAVAREHGVPMVENVPLAQSLYKSVEVGEFIPAALFEAVAEVLAYLIRLKQLAL
ncbi:MAG TPA: flagellar biosynthesis protein FlhB [Vicinamibacterales bacterium]|jgi:flagellar biosynthetic protein FlhB